MSWRRVSVMAAGVTLVLAMEPLAWSGSAWGGQRGGAPGGHSAPRQAATAGPVEVVARTSDTVPLNPALVSDGGGTSTAVWAEGCTLRAARRALSGGWSKTELVSRSASAEACWDPQVGVDRTGRVTVVWERDGRGQRSDILVSTRPRSGGWSPVVELTRGRGYRQGFEPQLRVAASGAALVTWQRLDGRGADFVRVRRGTRWALARPHHVPRLPADLMDTAVADNGTALVVGYDASGGSFVLHARRFVPGRGWGRARRMGSGESPRLVMNARGAGLLVWAGGRGNLVWYAVKVRRVSRTGRWGPTLRLTRFSEYLATTAVLGPTGQATVAWNRAGVTRTASQARPGAPWSGSLLSGLSGWDGLNALVQGQRGDQALLWSRWGETVSELRVAVRRPHGAWSPARLMGRTSCTSGRGATCSGAGLTVLPDGTALTAWVDPDDRLVARTLAP